MAKACHNGRKTGEGIRGGPHPSQRTPSSSPRGAAGRGRGVRLPPARSAADRGQPATPTRPGPGHEPPLPKLRNRIEALLEQVAARIERARSGVAMSPWPTAVSSSTTPCCSGHGRRCFGNTPPCMLWSATFSAVMWRPAVADWMLLSSSKLLPPAARAPAGSPGAVSRCTNAAAAGVHRHQPLGLPPRSAGSGEIRAGAWMVGGTHCRE